MAYIEAFVAPVPEANKGDYRAHARRAAELFKEHGVLEIKECWGTNVPDGEVTSFHLAVKRQEGEGLVMGWMVWPSKEARDQSFANAQSDPRLKELFGNMPFDGKRLIFGGFEPILEL